VQGHSKKDRINPNETVSYTFSNNLKYQITTNVSVDLDIEFDPSLQNREVSFIINSSSSINLQIRIKTELSKFGTMKQPTGPTGGVYQWCYRYNCIFRIYSNITIDSLVIRFKKDPEFALIPDYIYTIAIFESNRDAWEISPSIDKYNEDTLETHLESKVLEINGNTEYYITIFEVDDFSFWIWIIIIVVIGFVSITFLISKTEYFDFLRKRTVALNKGAHRLTLDEVLENENRNKIIDLVLKDPGIHFNELLRRTNLAAGNLVWHLDILETYKVVSKRRIGNFLSFFPYYQKNPISNLDLKLSKSKLTLEILELIEKEPGVWNSIITKRKKVDHKTIQYHIKKLIDLGLIKSKKEGRKRKFFPNFNSEYYNNKAK
jgi:predicted transcriptional regulator